LGAFSYLWGYFAEIGFGKSGANGVTSLEWPDIASWVYVSGIKLDSWEASTIIDMSIAYVDYSYKAKSPGCSLPKNLLYLVLSEYELEQIEMQTK